MNDAQLDDAKALAVIEEMRRSKVIVPPTLRESFTTRYVVALLIVALLSLGAGYSGVRLINAQSDSAAEVNVAGRQRMLSQRIALFSTLYVDARDSGRDAFAQSLRVDLATMSNAQAGLLEGDANLGIDGPPNERLQALYDAGVSGDVEEYLDMATALLDAEDGSADQSQILARLQATATGPLIGQLDAVVNAYQQESEAKIAAISREEKIVLAATLLALALEAVFVFRPMSRRISKETRRLEAAAARHQAEAKRHAFGIQLRDAMEVADSEDDLTHTIEKAHEVSSVPGEFEFLRTDPESPTTMSTPPDDVAAHHCTVPSADLCPAMRRGQALTFTDPEGLGACRHFRADAHAAGTDDVATTCVPVTFRGTGIGILRSVRKKNTTLDTHESDALATIALTAGTHIGTLRAFAASRADAEHDALTGLLNRRGIEEGVKQLVASDTRYVVAIADLDHFKDVNDTFGHDAGDNALEETARIMSSVLRPDDLLGRHGGEEFVVIIPLAPGRPTEGDLAAGVSVAERIRVALDIARATSRSPLCTVSIGVGSSSVGLESAIQQADQALYRAKAHGRNRVEVEGDLLEGLADVLQPDDPGIGETLDSSESGDEMRSDPVVSG